MTRARERLYLLNARRRYLFGQKQENPPSRFIKDIPAELLEEGERGGAPFSMGYGGQTVGFTAPRTQSSPPSPHNLAAALEFPDPDDIQVIPEPSEEYGDIFLGMRVRHGKFGIGTIRKIEGEGDGQKAVVWFNSVGPKKLMVRFAGLERA